MSISHIDRRSLLSFLPGAAALVSVPGGVTSALMRPAEKFPYGAWPNVSAEEWELEIALLRGDYVEVASAR